MVPLPLSEGPSLDSKCTVTLSLKDIPDLSYQEVTGLISDCGCIWSAHDGAFLWIVARCIVIWLFLMEGERWEPHRRQPGNKEGKNALLPGRWGTKAMQGGYQDPKKSGVQRRRGFSDCPFHLPFPNSSVLASYHGFNLDVEEPMVFQEDGAGFGQSVVQFGRSR